MNDCLESVSENSGWVVVHMETELYSIGFFSPFNLSIFLLLVH
jgi:hypothetical protein